VGVKATAYLTVRDQGGETRYYGDFREFKDVGGKREALKPLGAKRATTDRKLAMELITARIAELEGMRRRRQRGEPLRDAHLAEYSVYHLNQTKSSKSVTDQWLSAATGHLIAAVQFFCNSGKPLPVNAKTGKATFIGITDRSLESIGVTDVQAYIRWLADRPNRRGREFSQSNQRKYLNSLSKLFRRAISENRVAMGHHPVASLIEKPQEGAGRGESRWLEVHEAALLLAWAREFQHKRKDIGNENVYAIIATMLLTGGRPSEVFGLRVEDISFDRGRVTFTPHSGRRLKTKGSRRSVPLWPQLAAILQEHMYSGDSPIVDGLLFRSRKTGGMIKDIRKALDKIAVAAGWSAGDVRPYAFRHTFATARLQTLDNGHPVAPHTVAKELGHGGSKLVQEVYGHLGEVRNRTAVVEYVVEKHLDKLIRRLPPTYGAGEKASIESCADK
jgi:integrase